MKARLVSASDHRCWRQRCHGCSRGDVKVACRACVNLHIWLGTHHEDTRLVSPLCPMHLDLVLKCSPECWLYGCRRIMLSGLPTTLVCAGRELLV
jgi:hypothetical protein